MKFNVKHRECLRDHPSQRLMTKVPDVQIELEFRSNWILEMLVFEMKRFIEKVSISFTYLPQNTASVF